MIGRISGKLAEKQPPLILVDVNGVGYEIDVPMSTFYQLPATGTSVTLYTQLIVREDAHLLYGFASEGERQVFRQLLRVNGVGAKMALAVLSGLSIADLSRAVAEQDAARLTKVPGVGKKTAERLLLELRDKIAVQDAAGGRAVAQPRGNDDVLNALLALGYNEREAAGAVKQIAADMDVSEGIRQALRWLSKA